MYKTLKELMKEDILFMSDYDGYYYVKLSKDKDDTMWKVNKKTGEVSYTQLVSYFEIDDVAKRVDPEIIKKSL